MNIETDSVRGRILSGMVRLRMGGTRSVDRGEFIKKDVRTRVSSKRAVWGKEGSVILGRIVRTCILGTANGCVRAVLIAVFTVVLTWSLDACICFKG